MPQLQIFLSEDNRITHDLGEEKMTVGRLADNSLQIDDASISSHHAEIHSEGNEYHLHDLGSTNGTFVNGEQVTDAVLKNGDEVRFGRIESVFSSEEAAGVSQPLPESMAATAELAAQSARPAGFVSSSPIPRNVKGRDTLGIALYGLAVVAFLALGAAVYFVVTLQATA